MFYLSLYEVVQRVYEVLQVLHVFKIFWFYKLLFHVADGCHLALEERLATQGHRYEECGRKKNAGNLLLELCLDTATNGYSNMYHICVPELVAPNTMGKYEMKILNTVGGIN